MIKRVNDLMAILYLPFVLVWVAMVVLLAKFVGLSTIETFGLGTATGVILATFKDIYQYYFRKAPPDPAETTTTTTTTTKPPVPPAK
jgi:hypothetical protein